MKLAVAFNNTWTVTSYAEDRSGQTALGMSVRLRPSSELPVHLLLRS